MPETRETVLEIDLGALKHNYRLLRSKIRPEIKFMAVVKAFAYGSDAITISKTLEKAGVDYFSVAYVREGIALRKAGITKPILVLHPQPVNFEQLVAHRLEPSLYAPKILRAFLEEANKLGLRDYPVHLKFNTGLNRLGFWESDLEYIRETLEGRAEITIKGIFSHLAASDDPEEKDFTKKQLQAFEEIATGLESLLGYPAIKHMLNTSGILNYPDAQWNMVRSGIGLYGYGNDPEVDKLLRPVATLKTIISQLHEIEPGESVGYNRDFISDGYRTTATLPVGHADGIGRQYGKGKASVLVSGKKAPIIGNVCMDMLMIDVTGIDCSEGDEVIVFGQENSAEEFAATADTISYELITGISARVRRVYLED